MRIAVDARPLTQQFNGIGQYLYQVLDYLLTSPRTRGTQWLLYSHAPFDCPARWENATVRTGAIENRLAAVTFAQTQFGRWATQDAADVYWSPRHQLPFFLPHSIPAVVTLHDLVYKSYPETMSRFGRFHDALLTPRALKRATQVITTSNAVRTELLRAYPACSTKCRTIALSSDIAAEDTPREPECPPYAVFVGSMEPRKNLDRLIAAFEHLNSETAGVFRLVIISGGGWRNSHTKALINKHQRYINYHPQASAEKKKALLSKATFLALPSLYEGFGLPIVEAYKLGIPVLTSHHGAMQEIGASGALLIDPKDISDLTRGLQRLFLDTPFRAELAKNAAIEGARYSWQTCAEQTLDTLYEASAAGPDVPA